MHMASTVSYAQIGQVPQNYAVCLQIVRRYMALTYAYDPMPELEVAARLEQQDTLEALRSISASQKLITCYKTGQPIGALFNRAVNSHLPVSIAPSWMLTGKDNLASLASQQPIASVVYAIVRLALPFKAVQTGLQLEAIALQEAYSRRLAALYTQVGSQSPQTIAELLAQVLEFADWHNAAEREIKLHLQECLNSFVQNNLVAFLSNTRDLMTSTYARCIAEAFKSDASGLRFKQCLQLEDEAFIDECETLLTRARYGAVSKSREGLIEAKRKHQAIYVADALERKQRATARQTSRATEALQRDFVAALGDFFAPTFEPAKKPSPAPAPRKPVTSGFSIFGKKTGQ